MKRIAIFASGSGTNMQNIATAFRSHPQIEVCMLVCNKPGAGAIELATAMGIPVRMIDWQSFYHSDELLRVLLKEKIDLLVLAGFLWLVPVRILEAFPKRIINIHPALLPDFGGKGMYGDKVHQAVIDAKEPYSGITIHYVNEYYDEGSIIFHEKLKVDPDDSPKSLAEKIHRLEYKHYPVVIARVLEQLD